MVGKGSFGVRIGAWVALCVGFAWLPAQAAVAAECPGHPDAIGTERTIVVDPREHPRIGTMQYPETLPLRDHEVVLTFDDGPLPRHSNQILQILADNCVKATFFLIGQQARANPEGVRKLVAAGHSFGTHSQTHPLTFEKMSDERVRQEVDEGIASVTAALSDPNALAPFFRVPGLLRAKNVEDYLASKGIQVWSADFVADDWRHIPPARVYQLAMKRLEQKHKGILLLHDIQARTAAALPMILHEMKARGYHIVHVVPATPEQPATPTEPQDWHMRPTPEAMPVAGGAKLPTFVFSEAERLVAPSSDFGTLDGKLLLSGEPLDRVKRPIEATTWPNPTAQPANTAATTLPAPSESLFEIPEKAQTPLATAAAETPQAAAANAARTAFARAAGSQKRVARGGKAEPKAQVRGEKGVRHPVKVASLKKRER
ncbi:polysaccharide deacetylase family protein [Bradyrhizobium sp. ARR65]|uniref:polysaccharide deacetylase family protein n=1 Tax=Bradyrhizobium sp. ARR65 TaxID=1040989 RepID=UPI0004658BB8|nr:polysaccharide deacetylase family protein [Bradyrhizobium sp. ARR65]